jgi:hypothetical protein
MSSDDPVRVWVPPDSRLTSQGQPGNATASRAGKSLHKDRPVRRALPDGGWFPKRRVAGVCRLGPIETLNPEASEHLLAVRSEQRLAALLVGVANLDTLPQALSVPELAWF